jgi:5-methyltetrahydropteroyltriglutamate--homocysteine methyltransferase
MDLRTASAGAYPRIGDEPGQHALRTACARFIRGEIPAAAFRSAQDTAATTAIDEQVAAGLDVVTDGLVRWYDPVSHVAQALMGIRPGPLRPFFGTGTDFRQPLVRGPLVRTRGIVVDEYIFAAAHSPRPVKAVLTGPFTLAALSLVETPAYPGRAILSAYADVLAAEVGALASAGARFIQIDEPAVLADASAPADLTLLEQVLSPLAAAKGDAELTLALPFGDPLARWRELCALPVDVLGVDVTAALGRGDTPPANGAGPRLALGVVDGRSTRMEDPGMVVAQLAPWLSALPPGPHALTTSCGLEYVPRATARGKLALLAQIRSRLEQPS